MKQSEEVVNPQKQKADWWLLGAREEKKVEGNCLFWGMMKMFPRSWLHNIVNVLSATELLILKWLILYDVNFTLVKEGINQINQ